MKKLILFDFDGTLSKGDTLLAFFHYTHGTVRFVWNMLISIPVIVIWKLGLMEAGKGKNWVLNLFYKGWSEERLQNNGKQFWEEKMSDLLFKDALDLVKSYQKEGNTVVVVSANVEIHLKEFCKKYNLECLCIELLYENGIYTGKFATPNCDKQEKVNRIEAKYNKSDFDKVIAFGNSSGDKMMLAWADESHYQYLK